MEISALRLSGIIIGLLLILYTLLLLRRYHNNRGQTLLFACIGTALIIVGIFPGTVNLPAELFSLDDQPGGRLITLLLLSTLALWLIAIWERNKSSRLTFRYDRLVRAVAIDKFFLQNSQILSGNIKPVWIIIPALNEAENLELLLPAIPESVLGNSIQVLVVNDGSIDNTSDVSRQYNALVIEMPMNTGGGTSLRAGFDAALAAGATYIVTMDGDGQHDPEELSGLLKPLLEDKADLVIGSRVLGHHERASISRSIGVHFFNKMINLFLGTQITDCASGFRAINAKALKNLLLIQEQYHTAEMIIDACKRGMRIKESPITIRRRMHGNSKKGRDLIYGLFFLRSILKTWLR